VIDLCMSAAPAGRDEGIRGNTILILRSLLVGSVVSIALAALSVILQPQLSKYSLLVIPSSSLSICIHRDQTW
jgi:hypothetical protein